MKTLSNALFVIMVLACFASVIFVPESRSFKYIVRDRHSMEPHFIFDSRQDAEKYVKSYEKYHNYLIEERGN